MYFLYVLGVRPTSAASLGEVRNVVKDQHERIRKLESQISQMRLRREWGDISSQAMSTSTTSSSSTSTSSSTPTSSSGSTETETESSDGGSNASVTD